MVMNVCGIKEHEFQVSLNKKILVIASILTLIFDIFSGGFFLRQHGSNMHNFCQQLNLHQTNPFKTISYFVFVILVHEKSGPIQWRVSL